MYDRFKPLDDMSEGEKFWSSGRTVTEADCVMFTSLAGLKAPLFVDAEYAKKHGKYGQRVVPGVADGGLHSRNDGRCAWSLCPRCAGAQAAEVCQTAIPR